MDTIQHKSVPRPVRCRSIAFAAILVLATFVLSGSVMAQPKLKDILGKSPKEEKAAEEPKPETPKSKDERPPI